MIIYLQQIDFVIKAVEQGATEQEKDIAISLIADIVSRGCRQGLKTGRELIAATVPAATAGVDLATVP